MTHYSGLDRFSGGTDGTHTRVRDRAAKERGCCNCKSPVYGLQRRKPSGGI